MARILIATFGSLGDLYPYLAIGGELRRRGHAVTIATSAAYRSRIEGEGLAFAPIRPDVDLGDRKFMEWVFDQRNGSERIVRGMAQLVRESYEDTLGPASEADLIVTQPLAFSGPLIAMKAGKRWVSTILAPMSFTSVYDPPVLPQAPFLRQWTFLGPRFYGWIFGLGRKVSLDWVKPVVELGQNEVGLTLEQIGHPIFDGARSPWLTVAMFSPIFGPRQRDWPDHVEVTGFPFYEGPGVQHELAPELETFLKAGPPPVVFSLGSTAVGAAGKFYRDSFRAAERLGVRTVFLTGGHVQGLPAKLPAGMLEWPYAPHSALFPRAAVNVHHGGVGTTAEALRSGRPMLVVPFAHDQFDNAERCLRLGTARWIGQGDYNATRAEMALRVLLDDPQIQQHCAAAAKQIRSENGTVAAADAIESVLPPPCDKFTNH
ncbi:MAG: glycosyltransferase [Bryobacteraceae bacterium]|nr:glycosyltransferase [Bryobacteraceae bacterium]